MANLFVQQQTENSGGRILGGGKNKLAQIDAGHELDVVVVVVVAVNGRRILSNDNE